MVWARRVTNGYQGLAESAGACHVEYRKGLIFAPPSRTAGTAAKFWRSMLDFIARRLIAIVPVLAVVAVFVFLMLRLTPGDPAAVIAGDNATSDQIAMIREKLGLTLPIWQQFIIWIGDILQGNFGESYFFKKTVAELIAQRVEPTLALACCTLVLAISVAVPLGVIAAYRQGTLLDKFVMGMSVLGFSVPSFVIGYCLIYVFAIELGWLPVQGYIRIGVNFWGFLERMILPSITLGIIYVALVARITRASVLEVLNEDYIRTARAKGLSNRVVLMRHALRNAAVPILTVIGIGVALLIGGAVVTESVFGLPGLGRLTVEAVLSRDFPTIQTVILLFSVVYVVVNLLIDISYTLFDPRIRY
jgi:peptide/nickel transport system permease protein